LHITITMETLTKMLITSMLILAIILSGNIIYTEYIAKPQLLVATTTSLYDTGLLDALKGAYEAKNPVEVFFIPMGTGQAIENAKRGDVDLVLVHSPDLERLFLEEGYGVSRKIFAYNFFAIIGPEEDPAGIVGLNATEALNQIVAYGETQNSKVWISRGDNSGTHMKEKSLWAKAGFSYAEIMLKPWYDSAGSEMGFVIMKAEEFSAYTLADMGTYLKYLKDGQTSLKPLVVETRELLNVYSAIAVNPKRHPNVNFEGAISFIAFLVSDEGQGLIEDYWRSRCGQSLFYGAAKIIASDSQLQVAQWIREYAFINGYECPPQYRDGRHPELYSP